MGTISQVLIPLFCKRHSISSNLICTRIQNHKFADSTNILGGDTKYATLTKDTIDSFQKKIPPEALSQTFLDAIDIARELGVNYLWIDSLCIIQDDSEDWETEASSMSAVYGGSLINIAASGASNGSIGCFFKRENTWRCQIEVVMNDKGKLYDVVPLLMYEERLVQTPLGKRGGRCKREYCLDEICFSPLQRYFGNVIRRHLARPSQMESQLRFCIAHTAESLYAKPPFRDRCGRLSSRHIQNVC
jgi:hypothetical protein